MSESYWSGIASMRISRRRAIATSGGAVLGAAFVAACSGSSGKTGTKSSNGIITPIVDETSQAKHGGVFKSRQSNPSLGNFDPHTGTTNANANSDGTAYYRPLLGLKEGYLEATSGEIVGDVAESYELSPDKLSITMKINPLAHFAPVAPVSGRAVDAQDVTFTWDRFKTIGQLRSDYANSVNPTAPILSITATDDHTVVIKLNEPQATIFSLLSQGPMIVPKEAGDTKVLDLKTTPIGTGPFMLKQWIPSVGTYQKRNPEYKQDKRGLPFVDEVELPYLTEYAAALAQFRTGAIYTMDASGPNSILSDDLLPTKREIPALNLMPSGFGPQANHTFFGQAPNSPFKDQRVRQAYAMTWDRDLFNQVWFNVKAFAAEGVKVDTVWDSAVSRSVWSDWWIDPQGKDFGPNVKYMKHDLAEAKKLLTAAGFPNGIDTVVHYPGTGFSSYWYKEAEIVLGFVRDSGLFRFTVDQVNYNSEWSPKYRFIKGQFSDVAMNTRGSWDGDPVQILFSYYNSKGSLYVGGDSTMDQLTNSAIREFDFHKRQDLIHELQRHEAEAMFFPRIGSGTRFILSWPCVRNNLVWQQTGNTTTMFNTVYLDPSKPPISRA